MKRSVRTKFVVVSLAAIIAGGGLGSFVVMDGPAKVGIKGVPDLLAMMRDRSPGERTEGALSKKKKMAPVAAVAAERDTPEKAPAAAPLAAVAPVPVVAALPPAVAALPAAIPATVPAGSLLAIPPLFIPGGGGGGGLTVTSPPPGPPGGSTPPPPPGPIPEPSTWLMMILGFGMVGGMLRWRKSRSPAQDGTREAGDVLLSSSALFIR